MNPVRVAVIGAGHLGQIHAKLLPQLEYVKFVAVADPSPAAQNTILKQFDVGVVSDYKKLLQDIDAAIIATPTRSHFEIAQTLLKHSIHCLVEKPITDSTDDARQLVEIANQNRCVLSVGHVEQFNPAINAARETIGIPKFIQAWRCSGYTFRSTDIGVVNDLMIHDIDLVNSIVNGPLIDCRANGISIFGGNEDIAHARLEFGCGAVANLTASRCSFESKRSFQIFGTEGFANVDMASRTIQMVPVPVWIKDRKFDFQALTHDQKQFVRDNLFTEILPKKELIAPATNAILDEQRDWINAITRGGPVRNSGKNAVAAVEIAARVLQCINLHNWDPGLPSMTGAFSTPPINEEQMEPLPDFLITGKVHKRAA